MQEHIGSPRRSLMIKGSMFQLSPSFKIVDIVCYGSFLDTKHCILYKGLLPNELNLVELLVSFKDGLCVEVEVGLPLLKPRLRPGLPSTPSRTIRPRDRDPQATIGSFMADPKLNRAIQSRID